MPPRTRIVQDDITTLGVDAIVSPANSRMEMGGGLAATIRERGGEVVQEEAREYAPVAVGEAVITTAGDLPCTHVIHAPTMEEPAQDVTAVNTRKAMKGILACAREHGIQEVAVPGLGTGVGGVDDGAAARAMVDVVLEWDRDRPRSVVMVGYEDELYAAFREAVDG